MSMTSRIFAPSSSSKVTLPENWSPPRSPIGLIQEDLWPNEWKILVACLLLNLTTRKQVDGVIYELFKKYPTPEALGAAGDIELEEMIKPLGMQKKRSATLRRFSNEYLQKSWKTASDLHGCGKYANDCWRIFCLGEWRSVQPNDHALNKYVDYLKKGDSIDA